jgi:maleylpyruvate isomerase
VDGVTADPLVLNAELDRATTRLLATLDDLDLSRPSRCPGWTRGHVVTHLARNADAYINLLTWARTGVRTPAYASPEARDADIEAGSTRPAEAQRADLAAAATRLATAIDALPAEAWSATVALPSGTEIPAARLVWSRLCEVELHHVDLDAAYTPSDWPEAFSRRLLHDPATPRVPTVTGPVSALAAWLTGRGDGAGLTSSTGELPDLEAWK